MKKTVIFLTLWVITLSGMAQTIIHTKDGKSINLPVRQDEISSIEFINAPNTADIVASPKETAKPYLGTWARKEGSRVVEYMEITQSATGLDLIFRETVSGPLYGKATGKIENGNFEGKGTKRSIRMKINSKNQIEYFSSDPDGKNPWSSIFFRVN